MRNKVKVLSVVFCVVVLLGCLIGYSGAVSQMYYDTCSPYTVSLISGYEAKVIGAIPADQVPAYGAALGEYGLEGDMEIVEITYELCNPVNDKIVFWGSLCRYYGEDQKWIPVFDPADYLELSAYENCRILPPGESAFFREYVLVPKQMKEICAYRAKNGEDEEILIKL